MAPKKRPAKRFRPKEVVEKKKPKRSYATNKSSHSIPNVKAHLARLRAVKSNSVQPLIERWEKILAGLEKDKFKSEAIKRRKVKLMTKFIKPSGL